MLIFIPNHPKADDTGSEALCGILGRGDACPIVARCLNLLRTIFHDMFLLVRGWGDWNVSTNPQNKEITKWKEAEQSLQLASSFYQTHCEACLSNVFVVWSFGTGLFTVTCQYSSWHVLTDAIIQAAMNRMCWTGSGWKQEGQLGICSAGLGKGNYFGLGWYSEYAVDV